jgi:hypothetical protein
MKRASEGNRDKSQQAKATRDRCLIEIDHGCPWGVPTGLGPSVERHSRWGGDGFSATLRVEMSSVEVMLAMSLG